jgi:hypothetical protein
MLYLETPIEAVIFDALSLDGHLSMFESWHVVNPFLFDIQDLGGLLL